MNLDYESFIVISGTSGTEWIIIAMSTHQIHDVNGWTIVLIEDYLSAEKKKLNL